MGATANDSPIGVGVFIVVVVVVACMCFWCVGVFLVYVWWEFFVPKYSL